MRHQVASALLSQPEAWQQEVTLMRPQRTMPPSICAQCGLAFDPHVGNRRRFCSRACYRNSIGDPEVRFWASVDKDGPIPPHRPDIGPCWGWKKAEPHGYYGTLTVDGRQVGAHRWIWQRTNGPIQDGLWVLHHCDHRPCVRLSHLYLGTHAENTRDAMDRHRLARGDRNAAHLYPERRPRGAKHGIAKLTESDIPIIRSERARGVPRAELARRFGVSGATIWSVVTGETWGHA